MLAKIWLIALLAVVSSYSAGCNSCPPSCPAAVLGLGIGVYGAVDGAGVAVSGVEATLMGPTTVTLSCEPSANVPAATSCFWPLDAQFVAGTYTLLVAAPGFRAQEFSATLSVPPPTCGCPAAKIEPSTVTLDPS
jgi:hypothetical protein